MACTTTQSKASNGRELKTPKLPRVPKLPHFTVRVWWRQNHVRHLERIRVGIQNPFKHGKQPPRDVRSKRCSDNMQQIYRRTSMPKYDCKALWRGCSPVNMLHIFRTNFAKNTSGRLLLKHLPWNFWEK